MSGIKKDEPKDFHLYEAVENLSSEVQTFIDHVHTKAQQNLAWLRESMHPYFFAAFKDEPEAVSSLARNLLSLSNNHQLVLIDRKNTLILAKQNQRGSVSDSIEILKEKDISFTYISNSYANIPNLNRELEIQQFEFECKSDLEIALMGKQTIPTNISNPIRQILETDYTLFDMDTFDDLLNIFWSNNERYVTVSSPRRVARLIWLYQETLSHDGVYFDMEAAGKMGDKKETRIIFGVRNPSQKQFLLQLIKIFNRMDIGVHRCTCLLISNGTLPFFPGDYVPDWCDKIR